jgi:hypothetical protein
LPLLLGFGFVGLMSGFVGRLGLVSGLGVGIGRLGLVSNLGVGSLMSGFVGRLGLVSGLGAGVILEGVAGFPVGWGEGRGAAGVVGADGWGLTGFLGCVEGLRGGLVGTGLGREGLVLPWLGGLLVPGRDGTPAAGRRPLFEFPLEN